MKDGSQKKIIPSKNQKVTIVQTDANSKDGQTKCPKCGSTDISTDISKGKLRCNFCQYVFDNQKIQGMSDNISTLSGEVIASGASNINKNAPSIVTLKCESCGAEVVVDTTSSTQARCHWCRNMLSINKQIPNGAVPDAVLPFQVTKDDARTSIENFVGKRKFYAHPTFKKEFTTENIMGVYFPYMIIDVNSHVHLIGEGEHKVRQYTVKEGDNYNTYYDADLYSVEREFDLVINGLTVESNTDRLDRSSKDKTNNIINSIMPFDIDNCVKYDSNYLHGFTSEKRDVNIDDLKVLVNSQSKDVARFSANETLSLYDRGVRWDTEELQVKGSQWKSAYLPVWLYSYQQVKKNGSVLHYVAVNARTKETMGSVPIHMPKLLIVSFLVELLGLLLMILADDFDYRYIFLLSGIIYYIVIYARYRNQGARHYHEKETKREMTNIQQKDILLRRKNHLSNSRMTGANNNSVGVNSSGNSVLKDLANKVSDIQNNINEDGNK